MIAHDTEHGT